MNPLSRSLAGVIAALAMTVSAARAETVHFSFSNAVGEMWLHVDPAWGEGTIQMTSLDIYFDPATLGRRDFSDFYFNDPSRSFWRMRLDSEQFGTFIISRPLVLRVGEFSVQMSVLDYRPGSGVERLDLDANFIERLTTDWSILPGPLLPDRLTTLTHDPEYSAPFWHLGAGPSFFDDPRLLGVDGYGVFERSQVEVLDRNSPVPEPSTYGAVAVALLGVVLVRRVVVRRRAARASAVTRRRPRLSSTVAGLCRGVGSVSEGG